MRYLTRLGALRFQAELIALRTRERPLVVVDVAAAAAQGDRSENAEYTYGKKKLREIDRKIYRLVKLLEDAELVDPANRRGESRVYFGATVVLEAEDGSRTQYQLVGPDEADIKHRLLSFKSPLGALLLGKRAGDEISLTRSTGSQTWVIATLEYVDNDPALSQAQT
jgi:transcription elongation factor GreB